MLCYNLQWVQSFTNYLINTNCLADNYNKVCGDLLYQVKKENI